MKSIRKQLTLGLLAGLLLLVAICGAALFTVLQRSMTAQYDAGLLAKARALATLTQQESDGKIEFEFADQYMPEFERATEPEYFELWLEDGRVLERSGTLGQQDLPRRTGTFDAPIFGDLPLLDGRRGRAVGVAFVPQQDIENKDEITTGPHSVGPAVSLVLARSREDLDRTLHQLSLGMGGVGLLLPAGIALIVVVLVGRGLRPLEGMAARAASIDSGNLQQRFSESDKPRELLPICRRLNELLQRLEEAFARERRFTGSAAHELRTPIAELRSLTEVASMHSDDSELARRAVAEALAIAQQMERLVATLLALARGEAGMEHVKNERIDVDALLREAWTPFDETARNRRLTVHWDVSPLPAVQADRTLLRAVLSNLLDNAVTYCPDQGRIAIHAAARNDSVRLLIANTNGSLHPDDLAHLFEPFWQKDASRTDSTHSGLGLALAATFCRLMNVGVEARLTAEDQVAVELTLRPAPSENPGVVA